MNQHDKEFITNTIRNELSIALKNEIPAIVKAEIKTVVDASDKEMKQFITENVSNEINDLAMVTANGFARVDERFDTLENRIDQAEKKIDYIGENYVKDETYYELDKRVKRLEFAAV